MALQCSEVRWLPTSQSRPALGAVANVIILGAERRPLFLEATGGSGMGLGF
jgi:hypothetical protein